MTMMMRQRQRPHRQQQLLSLLLLWITTTTFTTICSNLPVVHGYASWLKCYIELDPEEVVMHHTMVPSHEARHDVVIEVQPYSNDRSSGSRGNDGDDESVATADGAPVPAPVDHDDEGVDDDSDGSSGWIAANDYRLDNDESSTMLKVRLRVPPALKFEDVQWVVEIAGSTSEESADGDAAAAAAAATARFIDLGVMCDGNRAFSRRHSEHVILQIDNNNINSSSGEDVTLVAGWAAGFEAVTLTPKMTLKQQQRGRRQEERRQEEGSSSSLANDNGDNNDEL